MAKPKRYWIRLTAEFDDGATYHTQREVTRAELDSAPLAFDVLGAEFDTLREMLNVGLMKRERAG